MVQFRYERLGVFYFYYGRIGHVEQFYTERFEAEEDNGVRLWGPDLRADSRRNGATVGGNRWLHEGGGANPRANSAGIFPGSNQASNLPTNQGAVNGGQST